MRTTVRQSATTALCSLALLSSGASAHAGEVQVTHEERIVAGAGSFHVCQDGTRIDFTSTSSRRYTTWSRDGLVLRERRHISFTGTLVGAGTELPYTGVWNRDEDLATGDLRITGGQFRVDLPTGRTLVGAGLRADGLTFAGSGDRLLVELCAAIVAP